VDRIRDGSEAYVTSRRAKFKQIIKEEYSKFSLNKVRKKILEMSRRVEKYIKRTNRHIKSDVW